MGDNATIEVARKQPVFTVCWNRSTRTFEHILDCLFNRVTQTGQLWKLNRLLSIWSDLVFVWTSQCDLSSFHEKLPVVFCEGNSSVSVLWQVVMCQLATVTKEANLRSLPQKCPVELIERCCCQLLTCQVYSGKILNFTASVIADVCHGRCWEQTCAKIGETNQRERHWSRAPARPTGLSSSMQLQNGQQQNHLRSRVDRCAQKNKSWLRVWTTKSLGRLDVCLNLSPVDNLLTKDGKRLQYPAAVRNITEIHRLDVRIRRTRSIWFDTRNENLCELRKLSVRFVYWLGSHREVYICICFAWPSVNFTSSPQGHCSPCGRCSRVSDGVIYENLPCPINLSHWTSGLPRPLINLSRSGRLCERRAAGRGRPAGEATVLLRPICSLLFTRTSQVNWTEF